MVLLGQIVELNEWCKKMAQLFSDPNSLSDESLNQFIQNFIIKGLIENSYFNTYDIMPIYLQLKNLTSKPSKVASIKKLKGIIDQIDIDNEENKRKLILSDFKIFEHQYFADRDIYSTQQKLAAKQVEKMMHRYFNEERKSPAHESQIFFCECILKEAIH